MAEGWIAVADAALDEKYGYQKHNKILQQIRALSYRPPWKVGGSREVPRRGYAGALDVPAYDYIPFEVNAEKLAGFTIVLRYELRTSLASGLGGTTLTPKVLNFTDNIVATIAGASACDAEDQDFQGTGQIQEITLTPTGGVKRYIPMVTVSNANVDVHFIVYLEIRTP